MSDNNKKNIKRKNLSDSGKDRVRSIKASKAASIRHAMKSSAAAEKKEKNADTVSKVPENKMPENKEPENKGPDLIWSSDPIIHPEEPKPKIRWGLLIPALIILICMAAFVVASQAGWINSFLTPNGKIIKDPGSTQEMTEAQTTTKKEKPTPTRTTRAQETTTEFVPSYYVINVNLAYNVVTVYTRGDKISDGWDPDDHEDDEYDLFRRHTW